MTYIFGYASFYEHSKTIKPVPCIGWSKGTKMIRDGIRLKLKIAQFHERELLNWTLDKDQIICRYGICCNKYTHMHRAGANSKSKSSYTNK